MTALEIIIRLLKADASVNSLTGGRIYAVAAPQGAVLPYAVVNSVSRGEGEILDGADGFFSARMSVQVLSKYATQADAIAELVFGALHDVTKKMLSDGSPEFCVNVTTRAADTDVTDVSDDRAVFRRLTDYRLEFRWLA